MPLDTLWGDRIEAAVALLQEHEPPEGYYLAFSGGKDSQCIYHLAQEAGVRFDAHFQVTTIDPPELLRFIRAEYPEVEWHHPEKTMYQLIQEYGMLPLRTARFCCRVLKEYGGEGRVVVTGIRAEESYQRKQRSQLERDRTRNKSYVHPILDWTETDVWAYHERLSIPHCSLYDEGLGRIGCVMCPMARTQRYQHMQRWPRIAAAWKRAVRLAFERNLERGREMQWQSPDEMWDWWLSDNGDSRPDDRQQRFPL